MPNKGQVQTQSQIDKEDEFLKLLKELFCGNEIPKEKLLSALKVLGYSINAASIIVKEWSSNAAQYAPENITGIRNKFQKLQSLEKALLKTNIGKKKYDELVKNNELKFVFS